MKECSVQGERRKTVTGQLGPKAKKRGKLNEAISPKVKRRLPTWLGLSAHKAELLLEDPLPIGKAEMFIVKDENISCCPDGPTSCYEDFSEDRITKGCSSFNDHI
jgi:hypothetical protein